MSTTLQHSAGYDRVTYGGSYGERIVSVQGYDGEPMHLGDRVEVHPGLRTYGRFGTVVGFSLTAGDMVRIRMDGRDGTHGAPWQSVRRARV